MLKADTRALEQNVNQNVLNIRSLELNYYTSFYITIGAQSALIGGFAYNAMTQISFNNYIFGDPYSDDPNIQYSQDTGTGLKPLSTNPKVIVFWVQLFQSFFYVSTALCLASAIYCIYVTLIMQVFGSGLALLGPIGSMARATKGLKSEMTLTFTIYNVMLLTFGISSFFSFWLVMDIVAAVISSFLTILIYAKSFVDCWRIYKNFAFDIQKLEVVLDTFEDDYDPDDDDYNNGIVVNNTKPTRRQSMLGSIKNALNGFFQTEEPLNNLTQSEIDQNLLHYTKLLDSFNESFNNDEINIKTNRKVTDEIIEQCNEYINTMEADETTSNENLKNLTKLKKLLDLKIALREHFDRYGLLRKELRTSDKDQKVIGAADVKKEKDYSQVVFVGLWKASDAIEYSASLLTYNNDNGDGEHKLNKDVVEKITRNKSPSVTPIQLKKFELITQPAEERLQEVQRIEENEYEEGRYYFDLKEVNPKELREFWQPKENPKKDQATKGDQATKEDQPMNGEQPIKEEQYFLRFHLPSTATEQDLKKWEGNVAKYCFKVNGKNVYEFKK